MYGAPAAMGARAPTSKVELSLSAKNLKDRDIISKSDPFAVLFARQGASWARLGQTEARKDDLNPSWTQLFLVDYFFESQQQFKVEVYDQDSSNPGKLSDQDFIGQAEFTLGQLMGAPGQSGTFLLTQKKHSSGHRGSLLVKAEEAKASSEAVRFRFSASSLANMDGMFSKSDPFLVISRQREDRTSWTQVFKSETIDNNLNPNWRPFDIPLQQLCNGDYKRPLHLQVFDEDNSGRSQLIGHVATTLEELISKRGSNYVLHNEELQRKKGKKYTNAGLLIPAEVSVFRDHTFIDYLRGGLEMNLVIGIDYTASNGPPTDPRSLHFINPRGPNQYQHAIGATVTILQEYDSDKKFPVYGFGGIPPGARDVEHCFALNLNPSNPEVSGAHGVLELYTASLMHIRLHGPTCFAPIIQQTMAIASSLDDPRKQKYFVLLIITDGAIMDMEATISALVQASNTVPLSVVIIGVGSADFSSMSALDGDGKQLRSRNGQYASRDIVQFVPYSRFAGYPEALTRETLAEIPRQLCQFMKVRGIVPNPAIPPTFQQFAEPTGAPAPTPAPAAAQAPPAQAPPAQAPASQAPGQPYTGGSAQVPPPQQQGYPGHPPQQPGYPPQQQGYPPQQQGYPPQQPGYPPQQQGYPPQQPGYPPQQQGYPPQQPGYPPQQPGYPPQQPGYPPQQPGYGYPGQAPAPGYYQQGGYPGQPGYPPQGGYPGHRG